MKNDTLSTDNVSGQTCGYILTDTTVCGNSAVLKSVVTSEVDTTVTTYACVRHQSGLRTAGTPAPARLFRGIIS